MYHDVKRVTKGGPIIIDTTPGGRHGEGASYKFDAAGEGDDHYMLETETVRQIMADEGIAHHFVVDPPLPPLETEAAAADANEEQPGRETAAVAEAPADTEDATSLDGSNETHTREVAAVDTDTARRRPRKS